MRLLLLSGLVLWTGATLTLSTQRWFARRPLTERLRPYSAGGLAPAHRGGLLSVESFGDVVGPLSSSIGSQVGRLFGVTEDLSRRLTRIHSTLDVTAFRVRQLGWAVATFGLAGLVTVALKPTPAMGLLLLLGGPLLAFLVLEQTVSMASDRWKRRLFLEWIALREHIECSRVTVDEAGGKSRVTNAIELGGEATDESV